MRPWELVRMAMATVLANPLRTALTMLGVIIGVASVFTLVSIGRGSSEAIAKQYESLGTNLLVVNLMGNGRATQLNYQELMQMESLPGFKAIAPTMTKNNSNIKYDRETETFNVIGTNDRYLDMQKGEVASGRFLAQADIDFRNHVAVIGSEVAAKFFGTGDPLGEKLNIDGYVYTIIGSLKSKGSNTSGTSLDSSIFVPLDTLSRDFKLGSIRTTYIEAATSENVAIVQSIVERYLQNKFNSTSGYNIFNSSQLISARQSASSTMTSQLVSVAAISLLVGGIGIMNIMLVTVSERTREIGIRKSIGAKRRSILLQFLVEAVIISGLGGLIGFVLGIVLSLAWPYINPNQTTSLSLDIGLYAFLFSVLVGVVFGLYPANKASKLKPIDALRTD
ncbi:MULTISPECIES: ABC transporter permease [Paenibacillus]|uniref:ABC transporter permease n=1 Tax=Paenibacillus naphthalenovorans TaxID=162209 RepID=A0A0U2N007_9BACL|nr:MULTISPECIES: ABC transporter permease [Paenibacillus]ALS24095.1 ABC transporter permease [Paenibacillus naphthalenovorans]SDJ21017.1 putative ABC transport system permease protein [Paenibacillus naphthalenovorans]